MTTHDLFSRPGAGAGLSEPSSPAKPGRRGRRASGAAVSDTRMALVRCGTEILTEQGFHATGIEEVLKRVGVPKGSFYHYFESKQAFGQAVIDNYAEYFAKKLDRLFGDTSRPPIERLKAFVEEATRAMERYQFQRGCLIGNMGQELAGLNDDFRARLESVLQSWQARVAGVLAQAQDRGQLSADADVNAIAEFFWIGWEGAILRAKLTRSVAPLDRFANLFFDRILPS